MTTTTFPAPVSAPFADPVRPAERLCRGSGVAAAALLVLAGVLAPDPPMHGGTDAMILAHYRTHHDGVLAGAFVWVVALLTLLLFVATVVRAAERARAAAGRPAGLLPTFTALTAAAATGMLLASQACTAAEAVIGQHATDTPVVRGLDEIAHMLAHLGMVPLGVLGLAMGLMLAQARVGSRAVAVGGAAIGVGLALSGSWVFVGGMGLHNAGVLCLFATLLWWIVQSVVLVLAGRAPRVRAGTVPTTDPLVA